MRLFWTLAYGVAMIGFVLFGFLFVWPFEKCLNGLAWLHNQLLDVLHATVDLSGALHDYLMGKTAPDDDA